jgi:hypothetical protein
MSWLPAREENATPPTALPGSLLTPANEHDCWSPYNPVLQLDSALSFPKDSHSKYPGAWKT